MKRLAALATLMMAGGCSTDPARLEVHEAWARESGGAETAAVYLTIANDGESDDRLIAVSTDKGKAGLHRSDMTGGIVRMLPVPESEGLEIPAHGTLRLAPGRAHIMLDGLDAPLKLGDRFNLTLRFQRSPPQLANATVLPAGATNHAGH